MSVDTDTHLTDERAEEMAWTLRVQKVDEIYLWTDDELHYSNNAPLTFSVREESYISAAALLDCGAKPNVQHVKTLVASYMGNNRNQGACLQLIGRCLRMIDASSDDPEALADELLVTLGNAIGTGSLALVRVMLKSYKNFINFTNSYQLFGAIDVDVSEGTNYAIAELLLECKCDPNGVEEDNQTPLHVVDDDNILKLLLEKGADPNIQDSYDKSTPFHNLRVDEDSASIPDIVKSFLHYGADPTIRDFTGRTPIYHFYTCSWYPELIETLEARDAARHLSLVMSRHPRLGARSMFQIIPEDVFRKYILQRDAYTAQLSIAPPVAPASSSESSSESSSDSE